MITYGHKVNSLPYRNLSQREDLLYYNGPLLTLFTEGDSKHVVFYWCDSDSEANRWLVFEIGERDVQPLRDETISLRELTDKCSHVYFVDIESGLQYREVRELHPSSIPPSYLPEARMGGDTDFYSMKSSIKVRGARVTPSTFFSNQFGAGKLVSMSLSAYQVA